MSRIDLDDLPPRVAETLAALGAGEELILVRGGTVVARLVAAESAPPAEGKPVAGLSPEEEVAEVLDHFGSIINDEF
jgi:antitoxin (DNA-binding transcriptional repressor) of toxin-antitoxin stability system